LPAVIHCHAGKDRTGFVSALLLHVLGVPHQTIDADYLRTGELLDLDSLAEEMAIVFSDNAGLSLSAVTVKPIVEVHVEYLEAALQQIDADYGTLDGYLERVGELSSHQRARLCELLLE
jgi:protein-tyrosine phosphatase